MSEKNAEKLQSLSKVIETVHRLRAPGGCPWDRAQTHQSLRPYLTEESHEVLEVIDQIEKTEDLKKENIRQAFREELGDLLMQVLLHAEMAREVGAFDFYDVAAGLDEKLVRRHPHVFGDVKADSADSAVASWEKQKAAEKAAKSATSSVLDGTPKGLPSLQRAARVIEKVTKVGFQWADMKGPWEKVEEELSELKTEVAAYEAATALRAPEAEAKKAEIRAKVEREMGDLLFTLANVAYLMKINPEDSLRAMLARFESRFRFVEQRLREKGKTPDQSDLAEMDQHWNEAKKLEKSATGAQEKKP